MIKLQKNSLTRNNAERNLPQNFSHESNITSNYKEKHLETPPSQTGSIISNSNPNHKNTITNENTTTSTLQNLKKMKKKRILSSSNNSASNSKAGDNNNNAQENINNEADLEPIMEAPPLEKIIKREDIYEFYINEPDINTNELLFKNNKISTTKYNFITFLPKALLYQFIRLANVYFVFMAILQGIPIISPLGPATAIAPLVFVLTVSLIREAIEDLKRRKLDNEQNSNEVESYINGQWVKINSGNLCMGEIIRVKKDGVFPSDLMLIDSNLQDGVCFIETGTLDGEKTLKIKCAPVFTKGKFYKIIYNCDNNGNNIINDNINNINDDIHLKKNSEINALNVLEKNEEIKLPEISRIPDKNIGELNNEINNDNNPCKTRNKKIDLDEPNINTDSKLNPANLISTDKNPNKTLINNNIISIKGIIQCDLPNPSLYTLNGKANMRINEIGNEFPLDAKNLLLKGAKLRNTDWIIGIVIYTGHNCKLMKNAKDPIVKMSSLESLLNKLLVGILFLQISLSIISCICHSIYYNNNKDIIISSDKINQEESKSNSWIDYLPFKLSVDSTLSFFTYLLLLNTMIPISLIVTLELVKIIQGLFIGVDTESYSPIRKKFITTNSVSLNEELGMVDYIFSDKTGTLTCNKMNLKFCVIGSQCFEFIRNGLNSEEININKTLREKEEIIPFENYDMIKSSSVGKININSNKNNSSNKIPSVKYSNYIVKSKENKNICIYLDSSQKLIEEYWKALALCHDCAIQNGEYIGMSPDNIELVKSASLQGFKFDVSESNTQFVISYINPSDDTNVKELTRFEKLRQIEFSSDRKRESVIVKEGSIYKMYTKGADSIIEERLDESTPKEVLEKSRYYVNLFSAQGFRTLYIAMKVFKEEEWEDFSSELEQAEMDTFHKKEKLDEIYQRIENGLTLIGSTIVEDKLQENVPEVIKELRQADIKIWMLTGDKLSTAYNIGLSCNLINKDIKTFFVEGVEKKVDQNFNVINQSEQEEVIYNFVKEYKHFQGNIENGFMPDNKHLLKFGILVDEKALLTITNNEEIGKIFLEVAKDAVAVICCRVSPLQKSQVVKLMKNYDKKKITLAIGDGGNDVSMIMEAHIGIGIYGEEGLRAAQSSDYAIGEFQVLRRLLFFHGYMNLMRNSYMVIYFFYKNFVFTIIHFFYGFINDFSGQTIIEDYFITLFNLVFTSIPLAARGILDVSLKAEDGIIVKILMPYLYKEQREKPHFNVKNFLLNLLKGIIHALINYLFTINIVDIALDKDGHESNLWVISAVLYTNILLIVSFDVVIFTQYHTWINWVIVACLTFLLYIIFLLMVEHIPFSTSFGTMNYTFNSALVWMNLFFVSGFCALFDFSIVIFKQFFIRSIHNLIKTLKNKDDINYEYIKTLPIELQHLLFKDDRVKEFNKNKIQEINNFINDINNNEIQNKATNIVKEENKNDLNDNKITLVTNLNKKLNQISENNNINNKENEDILTIKKQSNKSLINDNKFTKKKKTTKKKRGLLPENDFNISNIKEINEEDKKNISMNIPDKNNDIQNSNINTELKDISKSIAKPQKSPSKKPFGNIKFHSVKKVNNNIINDEKEIKSFELDDQPNKGEGTDRNILQ